MSRILLKQYSSTTQKIPAAKRGTTDTNLQLLPSHFFKKDHKKV